MSLNTVIQNLDNPIVMQFTGVDLTQATNIRVKIGTPLSGTIVDSDTAPGIVVITSPTVLTINAGSLFLQALNTHVEVVYFDSDYPEGLMIAGRQVGSTELISVDGFSTVVEYNPSTISVANSYVTAITFIDYCYKRGLPVPRTAADADRCLLDAMDYLSQFEQQMQGYRSSREQRLAFPRRGVSLYGWLLQSDEIPDEIKRAQMEAASYAVNNPLLHSETVSNIRREKLDVLETEYFQGGQRTTVRLSRVMACLAPLLSDTSGTLERT
jgi:hypothetical protein